MAENIATTTIAHHVDQELWAIRELEKQARPTEYVLDRAADMLRETFPALEIQRGKTKEGNQTIQIGTETVISKGREWYNKDTGHEYRDGLQAISMVTGDLLGTEIAADFTPGTQPDCGLMPEQPCLPTPVPGRGECL